MGLIDRLHFRCSKYSTYVLENCMIPKPCHQYISPQHKCTSHCQVRSAQFLLKKIKDSPSLKTMRGACLVASGDKNDVLISVN